jgi:hypothetical protein
MKGELLFDFDKILYQPVAQKISDIYFDKTETYF